MTRQRTYSEDKAFRAKVESRWGDWVQGRSRGVTTRRNTHSVIQDSTGDTFTCLGYALGIPDVLPDLFDEARDIAFENDAIHDKLEGSSEDIKEVGTELEAKGYRVDWPDDDDKNGNEDDEDDDEYASGGNRDALLEAVEAAHEKWHDDKFDFFAKVRQIGTVSPGFNHTDTDTQPVFHHFKDAMASFGLDANTSPKDLEAAVAANLHRLLPALPETLDEAQHQAALEQAEGMIFGKVCELVSDDLVKDGLQRLSDADAEAIMKDSTLLAEGESMIFVCHDGTYDFHAFRYHGDDELWSQKIGLSAPVASADGTEHGPLIEDPRDVITRENYSWRHPVGFFKVKRETIEAYARAKAAEVGIPLPDEPDSGPLGGRPNPQSRPG